jgi:hypothetical protein
MKKIIFIAVMFFFCISCKKELQKGNEITFKPKSLSIFSIDSNGYEKLQIKAIYFYNDSLPLGIDSISVIDSVIRFGEFSSKFYYKITNDTIINGIKNQSGLLFFDKEMSEEYNDHVLFQKIDDQYKILGNASGYFYNSFTESYIYKDAFNLTGYSYNTYPSVYNQTYNYINNIGDSIKISSLYNYSDGSTTYDTAYYKNRYYDYPISVFSNTFRNKLQTNFRGKKFDVLSMFMPLSSKPSKLIDRIYSNGIICRYDYTFDANGRILNVISNHPYFGIQKIVLEY